VTFICDFSSHKNYAVIVHCNDGFNCSSLAAAASDSSCAGSRLVTHHTSCKPAPYDKLCLTTSSTAILYFYTCGTPVSVSELLKL
jgi:hypothetical protein